MIRAAIAEARAFDSWLDYQEALKRAIAPLTEEQLQRRLIPGRRTLGEIAEHIVFGRALHLYRTLGEEAVELTPLLTWDDADDPPHSAAEIVQGLELTWRFIVGSVMRGSPTDVIPEGEAIPIMQVIWGLLDHDLPPLGNFHCYWVRVACRGSHLARNDLSGIKQALEVITKVAQQGLQRTSMADGIWAGLRSCGPEPPLRPSLSSTSTLS